MSTFNRADKTVLVTDVQTLGAIGVVRSLGRAGYKVVAASNDPEALGFRSNYAAETIIAPTYGDQGFTTWLFEFIEARGIDLIIPSEAFLLATQEHYDRLRSRLALPLDSDTTYRAFSKLAVTQRLTDQEANADWNQHLPPSLIFSSDDPVPCEADFAHLTLPIYVKSDGALNRYNDDAYLERCENYADAVTAVRACLSRHDAALVQGYVTGVKAAMSFCIDADGEVLTESGVIGLRTTPHTGGMMSHRKSWRHDRMAAVAKDWLRHLGWRGVAMVECKWDPDTDRFWLIEVNARYWGYLHLDLFAGVDVPTIQADAFFGRKPAQPVEPKLGVACRHTLPGDAGWLISVLKDRSLGVGRKVHALATFAFGFADVRAHSDLLFPGDRYLYAIEAIRYFRTLCRGLKNRVTGKSSRTRAEGVISCENR